MGDNVILKLEGISKSFPGVKALDNIQFELKKGEVHALVGENGAGKSTMMKILLGMYTPDTGEMTYKGEVVQFANPAQALAHGISMIHQEITLVPDLDVAENIWLGREDLYMKHGFLNRSSRYKATQEILERLNINIDPKAVVKTLSIAQMQLVEIVRAVSYNAEVVIMDEPTSALTDVETQALYSIIRYLSSKGTSVIYISHKLEEIYEVCDRVSVYRDGHYIETRDSDKVSMEELISMIAGRQLSNLFPKKDAEIGEVVLDVKDLCSSGVFKNVSFQVRKGEILGISGLVGAGRSEIMRAIFGIDRHDSGEIYLDGEKVEIHSPQDGIKYGIGMVTEDRLRMGSVYTLSVMANTTLAFFSNICNKLGLYSHIKERKVFGEVKNRLSIKCSSPAQLMSQLSGGNQQKAIIGRWLLTNPKVLILDEPTRGIDVGSKEEIYRLISTLAGQGMAIIMVSSELPEILGMCDRILVVRHGEIVSEQARGEATQESLLESAFGTNNSVSNG